MNNYTDNLAREFPQPDKELRDMVDEIKSVLSKDRQGTCEVLDLSSSELSRKLQGERGFTIEQLAKLLLAKGYGIYNQSTHVAVEIDEHKARLKELSRLYGLEAEK